MRRSTSVPTPFDMMALGWAATAAMSTLLLRSLYPSQTDVTQAAPAAAKEADDDTADLAPDEEVRLLHLME